MSSTRLIYFRKEVIRKGLTISASEWTWLIAAARELVASYGRQLRGHKDLAREAKVDGTLPPSGRKDGEIKRT